MAQGRGWGCKSTMFSLSRLPIQTQHEYNNGSTTRTKFCIEKKEEETDEERERERERGVGGGGERNERKEK